MIFNIKKANVSSIVVVCSAIPFPVKNGLTAAIMSCVNWFENYFDVYFYVAEKSFFRLENNQLFPVDTFLENFDIIILTEPINQTMYLKYGNKIKIALLSDCMVYASLKNVELLFRFKFDFYIFLKLLYRIVIHYNRERLLIKKCNYIFLQTKMDIKIIEDIYGVEKKLVRFSNSPERFRFPKIEKDRFDFAWVATFKGTYLNIASWFVENVIVPIAPHLNCKIRVVGDGAFDFFSPYLNEKSHLSTILIIEGYIIDLNAFYSLRIACFSPIFKGYGLINKTIEAIANGCIVIGDCSAFNGLSGEIGSYGIIAESANEFIDAIFCIKKSDEGYLHKLRKNGYENLENFYLEERAEKVNFFNILLNNEYPN